MPRLINNDALGALNSLADKSIDAVISDPPFGVTISKGDRFDEWGEWWNQINRIRKPRAPVVLFASIPFSFDLYNTNPNQFRYRWVWQKNMGTNPFHAKRMPLRFTEEVMVFGDPDSIYYPQRTTGHTPTRSAKGKSSGKVYSGTNSRSYEGGDTTRLPGDILVFNMVDPKKRIHSQQKPIDLMEYLIATYSQRGDRILDPFMGSGTTIVAAKVLGRRAIGIEKDPEYFKLARERIRNG